MLPQLLLFLALDLQAASPRDSLFRNEFVNYTAKDGLPSTVVYDVVQDDLGFMWFATESGISRFNGYAFENFTIEDGLPNNDIIDLTKDDRGLIWLHSFSGLAVCIPSIRPQFYTFHAFDGYGFMAMSKWEGKYQFLLDKDDKTNLLIWNPDKRQYSFSPLPQKAKYILMKGKIWKKDGPDLNLVFPQGKSHTISPGGPEIKEVPRSSQARHLLTGQEDILLFDGHSVSPLSNFYGYSRFPSTIFKPLIDRDGTLWVSSPDQGMFSYPLDSSQSPESYPSIAGCPISNMLKDRRGNYWFTSLSDGVFFLSRYQSFVQNHIPEGSSIQKRVQTVSNIENKAVAMGMGNSEVLVWNGRGLKKMGWNASNQFQRIRGVISFGKDTLLAYTDKESALLALNEEPALLRPPQIGFKDLQISHDRRMWFGGSNRIGSFSSKLFPSPAQVSVKTLLNHSLVQQRGVAICADRQQPYFWVGNSSGLRLWKLKDGRLDSGPSLLLNASILDINQSPSGDIWISTDGKGLFAIRNGYSLSRFQGRHFSMEYGSLSSNTCRKVGFGGNGEVWAATNQGVYLIEDFSWEDATSRYVTDHLNSAHGLLSNSVNDLALLNDSLYVGTEKGLTVLDLNAFKNREKGYSEVLITKVRILERDTSVQDFFELDYHERNIKFDFVALDYSSQENIAYRYKMEPMEKDWIETKQHFAHYPSLDPGSYTFMVKAINADGVESQTVTEVGLHVAPNWWDTAWFKLGAIVLLISLLVGIFYYRVRLIRKQEALKSNYHQQIADYQRQSLASQMNPHFIFNALVAVQGFILKSDARSANKYLAKFSKLIRNVLEGSQHKSISLAEEIKSLQLYLELELLRFGDRFQYEIQVSKDLFPSSVRLPPMILQPFVENAIRHGLKPLQGNGRLLVSFGIAEDLLKCTIEDNGVGRDRASELKSKHHTEYQSRGMELTTRRIELLNQQLGRPASVEVKDLYDAEGQPCGTRVTLYFPSM